MGPPQARIHLNARRVARAAGVDQQAPSACARRARPPARRLARCLALGVLGLVVAPGCGDAFGVRDVLGVWNTQSIDGYAVPGTVVYEGTSYDTQYVRWTFYDGGECILTQRVDDVKLTYDECEYTVSVEQATIAIVLLSETWDGSVENDRMTITDPQDVVWVLRPVHAEPRLASGHRLAAAEAGGRR